MIMRNVIYVLMAMTLSFAASAQSQDYQRKYNLLLERVGPAGVGMETLIENWGQADPNSLDMLQARFYFYIAKAQGTEIVARQESKYLGVSPVLTLKDSTGANVHYYEVVKYDDELFAEAIRAVDKGISLSPDRLDWRFMKANAYRSYELESPDVALSNILGLVHDFMNSNTKWLYKDSESADPHVVDKVEFVDMMKQHCVAFYSLGTPSSYRAFLKLSQKMNGYFPKDADFIGYMGTYYLVAEQDYKAAVKHYDKALKLQPGNKDLINNALIAARKMKNTKLEKKYRKMLEA